MQLIYYELFYANLILNNIFYYDHSFIFEHIEIKRF